VGCRRYRFHQHFEHQFLAGAEVAQLYIKSPDVAGEPVRQLRGFENVMIQPGGTRTVTFELKRRDLSVLEVDSQIWEIEDGDYTLYVAASSRYFRAQATLTGVGSVMRVRSDEERWEMDHWIITVLVNTSCKPRCIIARQQNNERMASCLPHHYHRLSILISLLYVPTFKS
jgi:hypothetical protein